MSSSIFLLRAADWSLLAEGAALADSRLSAARVAVRKLLTASVAFSCLYD